MWLWWQRRWWGQSTQPPCLGGRQRVLCSHAGALLASWECLGYHHCFLSPACRQKLHEADLELQRKREYIEELEPPTDSSSERCSAARWVGGVLSLVWS